MIEMTSLAQKQIADKQSARQAAVHDFFVGMDLPELLDAVLAHIEARPDLGHNAVALEKFSNSCGRIAWKHN